MSNTKWGAITSPRVYEREKLQEYNLFTRLAGCIRVCQIDKSRKECQAEGTVQYQKSPN